MINCNYKVKITDIQNKYKFKIFALGGKYDDTVIKEEIDKIVGLFPRVTGEGTNISLNNTLPYYINLDLKGNGGNNLFDELITPENYSYNSSGVKTSDSDACINQELNDIDFSAIYVSFASITGSAYVRVCEYNSSGTFIKRTLINSNQSMSLDSNTQKLIFSVNASGSKYFTKLMINEGSTVLPYEPYGASVTGDNTISVEGSQLWQGSKDYTGSGTVAQISQTLPAGTFTVSFKQSANGTVQLNLRNDSENVQSVTIYSVAGNVTNTFTVTSNDITKIWLYFSTSMTVNDIMINKGSTALPYQAYNNTDYSVNLGLTKLKVGDSIQGTIDNWSISREDGTTETITDATLISRLNDLKNAMSEEGQTNISQTNADMPFIINASAIFDLSTLI